MDAGAEGTLDNILPICQTTKENAATRNIHILSNQPMKSSFGIKVGESDLGGGKERRKKKREACS